MTTRALPRLTGNQLFVATAVRRPGLVGAIAPSSRRLAEVLASVVPTAGAPVVIELGPGTGVVTRAIRMRAPVGSRHVAVEADATLAADLRVHHPGVEVVCGDAVVLRRLLAERGIDGADVVVSGLPWSLFPPGKQAAILGQIRTVLAPTGVFTTFAYSHTRRLAGAQAFRRAIDDVFDEVLVSSTVWRNLPPAHTYVCRRPDGHG